MIFTINVSYIFEKGFVEIDLNNFLINLNVIELILLSNKIRILFNKFFLNSPENLSIFLNFDCLH